MNWKTSWRDFGNEPILEPVPPLDWWWGLVAMVGLICVLGITGALDARSQRMHSAAAVEQRVREELKQTVVAAYRQGRSDALEAVHCMLAEVRP